MCSQATSNITIYVQIHVLYNSMHMCILSLGLYSVRSRIICIVHGKYICSYNTEYNYTYKVITQMYTHTYMQQCSPLAMTSGREARLCTVLSTMP